MDDLWIKGAIKAEKKHKGLQAENCDLFRLESEEVYVSPRQIDDDDVNKTTTPRARDWSFNGKFKF